MDKYESEFIEIFKAMDCSVSIDSKTIPLYDEPIFGFAGADDELYDDYKKDGVIGSWYMKPSEWLDGAKSVISFFLPFSKEVKEANSKVCDLAAIEWAYARVEGQSFLNEFINRIAESLQSQGMQVVIPTSDKRFFEIVAGHASNGKVYPKADSNTFGSAWSERHAAFAAGLGTFGMSRGLITKKGMAGRFGSLIIDKPMNPTKREYTDTYQYCIKCGACANRCPVGAIPEGGVKDHSICAPRVELSKKLLAPRYGCGLCQTAVPCMSGIPVKIG